MQLKYTIIEGDDAVVNKISDFFEKDSGYSCVGVAKSYDVALDIIIESLPDFVFIDVDIVEDGCFNAFNFVNELYKYVNEIPFIIGLSNSKDHAYNCMKNEFFDYILKPINPFELRKSMARLRKKPFEESTKICLKSYKDYRYVDINEILFLKADNTATDFYMNDGSIIGAYKTLKTFEEILPQQFTRIHNSYIVNQKYVSRIHFGKSKCTIKQNSFDIPFSKSFKNNVEILEKSISKRSLLSLN